MCKAGLSVVAKLNMAQYSNGREGGFKIRKV